MRLWWRRRPAAEVPPEQPRESARALEHQTEQWPEVNRLGQVIRNHLEDNHLSPRIAALYRSD